MQMNVSCEPNSIPVPTTVSEPAFGLGLRRLLRLRVDEDDRRDPENDRDLRSAEVTP